MLAKPVFVFHQAGIADSLVRAVVEGVNDVFSIAGINLRTADAQIRYVNIEDMGCWRAKDADFVYDDKLDKKLVPYASIDWYVETARRKDKAIDSRMLLDLLRFGPFIAYEPNMAPLTHYKVVLVQAKITHPANPDKFVQGCVRREETVILTTNGLEHMNGQAPENIKTVIMHKMGHLLGLISEDRTWDIRMEGGGVHCTNLCVMRRENGISTLERHTYQRLRSASPFCDPCASYLRKTFQH